MADAPTPEPEPEQAGSQLGHPAHREWMTVDGNNVVFEPAGFGPQTAQLGPIAACVPALDVSMGRLDTADVVDKIAIIADTPANDASERPDSDDRNAPRPEGDTDLVARRVLELQKAGAVAVVVVTTKTCRTFQPRIIEGNSAKQGPAWEVKIPVLIVEPSQRIPYDPDTGAMYRKTFGLHEYGEPLRAPGLIAFRYDRHQYLLDAGFHAVCASVAAGSVDPQLFESSTLASRLHQVRNVHAPSS
jgi:hypothetical protein